MIRALAKGAVLLAFGRFPGGVRLYRSITRRAMGTQATHVDKLARVWPAYVLLWHDRCGIDLEGKTIWMHESGWTPFPNLMFFLLTGRGGVVTNSEATVLPRYMKRSFAFASDQSFLKGFACEGRREVTRRLSHLDDPLELARAIDARSFAATTEIADESVDICHSGGVLEHCNPGALLDLLTESYRVMRPGGIASHVFDMRDHLYHADKRYPFLNHLAYGDRSYNLLFGHELLYHNRLLPAELSAIFEQAGFELIALRRLLLPDSSYVDDGEPSEGALCGLPRRRLAARFTSATDADLHTAACHFLLRKR